MDLHRRRKEAGNPVRGGLHVVLAMEADLYNAVSAAIIHIS
jgi:hypothetical protein